MKSNWKEELKTLLKDNRSKSQSGGSGEKYWNSVIAVIEKYAQRHDKEAAAASKYGRSEYWQTMVDILEKQFPKGECKERGRALVMLAYIEMMLTGTAFNDDGEPVV